MKTIGIIGTRSRDGSRNLDLIRKALLGIYEQGDEIVSGGCPQGGDRFAEMLAKEQQIPIKIYYAQWMLKGKSAGFQRNELIARDADVMIACVALDRKGGTEDTIKKYLAMGKTGLILV
jgi:hypothetical protein